MKKFWKENKEDLITLFWTCVTFACMFASCQVWMLLGDQEVKTMIDMSEIYETLRTSSLRKVSYEDDEISIIAYKVGNIIRIDVKEVQR